VLNASSRDQAEKDDEQIQKINPVVAKVELGKKEDSASGGGH
jgi:hypothetical protein